jgi:hypothetical protein
MKENDHKHYTCQKQLTKYVLFLFLGVTNNVLSSSYAIGPMNSTANVIEVRQNVRG